MSIKFLTSSSFISSTQMWVYECVSSRSLIDWHRYECMGFEVAVRLLVRNKCEYMNLWVGLKQMWVYAFLSWFDKNVDVWVREKQVTN